MNGIEYIKNAIKEWGGYLIDNKNKIQAIIDLLEDDRSLWGEDNKIIKYAKIILDNLFNMEKKRIYRGIALSYMKEKNNDKIDNYVNSKEEAWLYGEGLVLEYEYDYKDSNIIEEAMRVRKEDVREYDEKIRIRNIKTYLKTSNVLTDTNIMLNIGTGARMLAEANVSVVKKKMIEKKLVFFLENNIFNKSLLYQANFFLVKAFK